MKLAWEGKPEETLVLVVKSQMQDGQQSRAVVVDSDGVPRGFSKEVPRAVNDVIANAMDLGTFTALLTQHAKALNGISSARGRGCSRALQTRIGCTQ